MKKYEGPSLAVWREYFDYDPKTGHFTIKKKRHGTNKTVGDRAEYCSAGYLMFCFDYGKYQAHKVAWFFIYGEWPEFQIDHRDLNRSNNSKANIRRSSYSENNCNKRLMANNTSGYKGVCWFGRQNSWIAYVDFGGKRTYLGYHKSAKAAADVRRKAAAKMHGEFARFE